MTYNVCMENEKEVIERFQCWAHSDDSVRAIILRGSETNPAPENCEGSSRTIWLDQGQ